jgi:TRAP-type C4-dicarboxylate transport system substrate-binding protein
MRKYVISRQIIPAILVIVLITVMAFAFPGCSKPEPTAPEPEPSAPEPEPTPEPPEAEVEPITLIFSSHDVEGGSWAEIFGPFFAEIEERTNGGIIIEDHWNAELAGFFESYATCAEGTVDLTQSQVQMYPNFFPMEDITTLVSYDVTGFGRAQMWQALTEEIPELNEAFANSNTKLLFRTSTYPNYATMREGAAIRSFADFEGKKFLTTGEYDSMKWEALGMVPVSSQPEETTMNVQTGVLDGVYFTTVAVYDFGMTDIIKYMTFCNIAGGVFSCVINLDTWNSLSAEYQQIIEEAAAKVPALQDAQQKELDGEYGQKLADLGVEFFELSDADMARLTDTLIPIREHWVETMEAKGLPGQEVMDTMLELEQKYCGD